MTKPMTTRDKRLKAFDRSIEQRRGRFKRWLAMRDEEEIAVLAYLCEGYNLVHKDGQLAVKAQPIVVSPTQGG